MGNANFGQDLLSGANQGAQLAMHIEQVQKQRNDLEQQKQQQFVAKTNYVTSKMRDGLLLPKGAQDSYFRLLQAQAEHLQIPYDKSAESVIRDPENRTAALAGLNHMIGLPDNEKTQAGQQFFAMLGGDVNQLTKLMLGVKEAQSKAALAQASMGFKQANLSNRIDQAGTNKVDNDKSLNAYDLRLQGVARINDLLAAAKRGQIVTNEQVKNLIGEEVARLELGAGTLGLGQSERNTLTGTFKSQAAHIEERVTGRPQDAITAPQLAQMVGQLKVMTDSYMQQYDSRIRTLRSDPRPEVQSIVDQKANEYRQTQAERFGSWNGLTVLKSPDAGKRRFVDQLTPDLRQKFAAKYGPNWDTSDAFDKDFRGYQAKKSGAMPAPVTPTSGQIEVGKGGAGTPAPASGATQTAAAPPDQSQALDIEPAPDDASAPDLGGGP